MGSLYLLVITLFAQMLLNHIKAIITKFILLKILKLEALDEKLVSHGTILTRPRVAGPSLGNKTERSSPL